MSASLSPIFLETESNLFISKILAQSSSSVSFIYFCIHFMHWKALEGTPGLKC